MKNSDDKDAVFASRNILNIINKKRPNSMDELYDRLAFCLEHQIVSQEEYDVSLYGFAGRELDEEEAGIFFDAMVKVGIVKRIPAKKVS